MATEEFHEEIKKWNNEEKLLELAKFKCNHSFTFLYWILGVLVTVFVIILNIKEVFLKVPYGVWIHSGAIAFLGISIMIFMTKMKELHATLYDNISYLSRKIDGQFG